MEADRRERERLLDEIDRLTHRIQLLEKGLDQPEDVRKNSPGPEEKAIKDENESIRSILNSPFEGIALHDNCIIVDVNDTLLAILGFSRSEVIGACTMDFLSEDSRQGIREIIAKGMEKPQEVVLVRKDGKLVDIEFSSRPCIFMGRPLGMISLRDISERKQTMAALKESETLYRTLVETSPDAILVTDLSTNVLMANQQALKLFDVRSREDLVGQKGLRFVTPENLPLAMSSIKRILEGGLGERVIYSLNKSDGTVFMGEVSSAIIRDTQGIPRAFMLVVRDITQKQKYEEEMLRAQKIESIGALAGGIAHDFNNILTAILSNINLAKMLAEHPAVVVNRLGDAEKATLRAKNLTQQLLTFARGGEPVKEKTAIGDLLRENIHFALAGSNLTCDLRINNDIWPVDVDIGQIGQAINNIIINAKQAMPNGGKIDVAAENIFLVKNQIPPLSSGKYTLISFTDYGVGIPADNLSRIFDPYFTTKAEGSGMGLTSTYSIIKRHGGYIQVKSEVNKGTTFYVYLPASDGTCPKTMTPAEGIIIGKGKILLMDDEVIIRESTGELVRNLGYVVECAIDGEDALTKFIDARQKGDPFDAVIIDLTVPGGMGGKELIAELLRIDSKVKAIVSSGYSKDPILSNFKEYGFVNVLNKPYRAEDLSKILKKVVNSTGHSL